MRFKQQLYRSKRAELREMEVTELSPSIDRGEEAAKKLKIVIRNVKKRVATQKRPACGKGGKKMSKKCQLSENAEKKTLEDQKLKQKKQLKL